ncbi:MAG: ferritin [Chloroflexi bacterium]|nr:MAG: ferritin [Phototrophicales bacterium]RMF82851.1 MAG: ferritin [Chloroflexota bacterium]
MLSEKMQDALNQQINAEFYASYLYLSMAAYFEAENLLGFANWMRMQSEEENMHAMKIYDFVNERDGRVILSAIDAPPTEWDSALAAFEASLAHERKVTGMINDLVDLALDERDHATNSFLQWFVDEQVEEEASVDAVIQDLKRIGESPQGLFLLDRELGQRGGAEEV